MVLPITFTNPKRSFFVGRVLVASDGLGAAESVRTVARAEVDFVEAENFTDCGNGSVDPAYGREPILAEIEGTIEKLAERSIADGHQLTIKVTDIDLAGAFEPWHSVRFSDGLFFREVYPPSVDLEFRLTAADGEVIREGRRQLSDPGYLMTAVLPTWDQLRYEKPMLREWMAREFKRSAGETEWASWDEQPAGGRLFF